MSWKTIIIGCESVISLSQNRMKVTVGDEYHNIPIGDLDNVIFSHDKVKITIPLLVSLMENNVNVIICNSKNDPIGTFNSFNGHSLVFKQLKKQMDWKNTTKKKLWKIIIENKIQSQIDCLQLFNCEKAVVSNLKELKSELKTDDHTNREAIAARIYFMELFGKEFKRDEESVVNFALDYGYKIIASYISKCVVARGYLPQLGIHHIGESNPFNLTYDFIESFRPLIDSWVYVNVTNKFGSIEKQELIQILESKVYVNGKWFRLKDAIEDIIDSYLSYLNGASNDVLFFDLSQGVRDD